MKYTVTINETARTITVDLNGYKGVAKCCATDQWNITTGIELALERAKVAQANANKPKPTVTVAEAIKVLENYVGDHIAIIGKGVSPSENQKNELRRYADMYAPTEHKCCDCCDLYDDCVEGYEDDDYDDYDEDDYDDYEPNCGCHDNGGCKCGEESLDTLATRMIKRIREILAE